MIARIVAFAALALAATAAIPQPAPRWVAHNVEPDTIRTRTVDGIQQFEAIVLYADDQVAGRIATAVTGCRQGHGHIAQIDDQGVAQGQWQPWSITGAAWRDSIARSICLVAAHSGTKPRATGGWL